MQYQPQYIANSTIRQVSETAVQINGKVIEFNRPLTYGMLQEIIKLVNKG